MHVAIDDHSCINRATIKSGETGAGAARALVAAVRHYRHLGLRIIRLLTDNGACYASQIFAQECRWLGIEHRRKRA